jgi:hypothetical protein
MQEKFKGVQFATAKRVLDKFYRNVTMVEQETHMEDDPGKPERMRIEQMIANQK